MRRRISGLGRSSIPWVEHQHWIHFISTTQILKWLSLGWTCLIHRASWRNGTARPGKQKHITYIIKNCLKIERKLLLPLSGMHYGGFLFLSASSFALNTLTSIISNILLSIFLTAFLFKIYMSFRILGTEVDFAVKLIYFRTQPWEGLSNVFSRSCVSTQFAKARHCYIIFHIEIPIPPQVISALGTTKPGYMPD